MSLLTLLLHSARRSDVALRLMLHCGIAFSCSASNIDVKHLMPTAPQRLPKPERQVLIDTAGLMLDAFSGDAANHTACV